MRQLRIDGLYAVPPLLGSHHEPAAAVEPDPETWVELWRHRVAADPEVVGLELTVAMAHSFANLTDLGVGPDPGPSTVARQLACPVGAVRAARASLRLRGYLCGTAGRILLELPGEPHGCGRDGRPAPPAALARPKGES